MVNAERSYEVFIAGETVALCIPDEEAIEKDGWSSWFNDVKRMSNTSHAVFPTSRSRQRSVLESIDQGGKISLLICHPETLHAHGIVSLQNVDLLRRSAEIAIHLGSGKNPTLNRLAALEAMALMTEHGFDQLGLIRIFAGQSYPGLKKWNRALEIIGYRTEGISRNSFVRGHFIGDSVMIACLYENFLDIKKLRGSLWGGLDLIRGSMKAQPSESHAEKVDQALRSIESDHYKFLQVG